MQLSTKRVILKIKSFVPNFVLFAMLFSACVPDRIDENNKIYREYQLTTSGAGEAMDAWTFERMYPFQEAPFSRFFQEYKKAVSSQPARRISENQWSSLGPDYIAGRTLCMAFHPTDPLVLFAGSASGGLWKTSTGGKGRNAWEHVPTGYPVLGVAAILIHPTDPMTMYVGTGETYNSLGIAEPGIVNRLTRGTYGIGVLKTEDGGQTWSQVLPFVANELTGVLDMEFGPDNTSEIYVATNNGLYFSPDAGLSWDKKFNLGPCVDIEIDPENDSIIYLSRGNLNSNLNPALSGLYKSTDKGETFTELLDDGLLTAWSGNAKLAIHPENSNTIFASIQVGWFNTDTITPGGIFRSQDQGENWTRINNQNVAYWQGWYSHDFAINPSNPDEWMYVGIDGWKSVNGGQRFYQKSQWGLWPFGKVHPDSIPHVPNYIHADIHGVYYHPLQNDFVYVATDGGVFGSEDGGETWSDMNGGMQTLQFYANIGNSTTDSNFIIGGAQDNSTFIYDGTPAWTRDIGGDGLSAAINPQNDNIVYASAQNLFLARSDDRGRNFFTIIPPLAQNELTAFASPFELAPSQPNIVYAGAQFLYRSDDFGDNWQATSSNQVDPGNVLINICVSPLNPDKVVVSTSPNPFGSLASAKLMKSLNGGESWLTIDTGLPNRLIKDIAMDPTDDDILYVVLSGFGASHFAKSLDGGNSWELNQSLPDVPASTVVIDPENRMHIYVGNDLGVYLSTDQGSTWSWYSDGLPDATMVEHLSISPSNRKLRAATHGRGLYEVDLVEDIMSPIVESEHNLIDVSVYPNPASNQLYIHVNGSDVQWKEGRIVRSDGKLVRVISNNSEFDHTQKINVGDLSPGAYFIQLTVEGDVISKQFIKS